MRFHRLIVMMVCMASACSERGVNQRSIGSLFSRGAPGALTSTFGVRHHRYRTATDTTEGGFASALLRPESVASTVRLNGLALVAVPSSEQVFYSQALAANSIYLNVAGGMNVFTINGVWASSFTDSLPGPTAKTLITSPAIGATVSKSSGFTISWSPTTSSASVVVSLADTALGAQSCGMKHFASDPGSVTFSSSDLSCLSTGTLNIIVERGFTKLDSITPTKFIRLVLGSADEIPVTLTP